MSSPNPFEQFTRAAFETVRTTAQQAAKTVDELEDNVHDFFTQGTETIGNVVTPIAENPVLRSVTQLPMLRWFMAALGQVDIAKVQQDIQTLRQQNPQQTRAELTQHIIRDTTLKAAGVGLATNIIPPIALSFMAIDYAALSALQAEMLYRIAAIYDLPLNEPARRGEVLTIYGIAAGGTGVIKAGLSIPEMIPILGAVIGASSDAAIVFSLGQVTARFYERKFTRMNTNPSQQ
jgi:uncharacterized protein (DUF697 family)